MATPVDDHHLLARFRREQEHARILIRELERASETGIDTSQRGTRDPVDALALRGIPAIGGRDGVGGAIRGTRPDQAVLRLDR